MALRDIDDKGNSREVKRLEYEDEFNHTWLRLSEKQRAAIEGEINRRLDELIASPDPNWGSITNTSLEGGRSSPTTGKRGDWTGTVFAPIFEACGFSEERSGMFYGNLWKRVIIERPEEWVGIRSDPTFPQRGITLQGKTYFLAK